MTPRRPRRTPPGDVVVELRARTAGLPSANPGGGVPPRSPDGTVYPVRVRAVEPDEARRLAGRGAQVAWDECGCGANDCLIWFDGGGRAALAAATPDLSDGDVWLWTADDGGRALVADNAVTWSDLLD